MKRLSRRVRAGALLVAAVGVSALALTGRGAGWPGHHEDSGAAGQSAPEPATTLAVATDAAGVHKPGDAGAGVRAPAPPETPPPPPPRCTAAGFSLTAAPEHPVYHAGEAVWVILSAHYRGQPCLLPDRCQPFVWVVDAAGRQLSTTMVPPSSGACGTEGSTEVDSTTQMSEAYPWDQKACSPDRSSCSVVPRGSYQLVGDWHDLGRSQAVSLQLVQ